MVMKSKIKVLLFAMVMSFIALSSGCHAYVEFLDMDSDPSRHVTALSLTSHEFSVSFQIYADETVRNCSLLYAYSIYEPYKIVPRVFVGYGTVYAVHNATSIVADNVTWNNITVTLPVRDEAESRYVADVVCHTDTGEYELGCLSGCFLPDDIRIYDYTEGEGRYRNLVSASRLGEVPSGFILGLADNVSISVGIIFLVMFATICITVAVFKKVTHI